MKVLRLMVSLWIIFFMTNPEAWAKTEHHKRIAHARHHKMMSRRLVAKRKVKKLVKKEIKAIRTYPIYGAPLLASELNKAINAVNSNASIGVYVKSMRNGEALFTRNIYQPLMPASTLKVLTAEAGFIYLGSDYRFSTQLLTDAKTIKKGVLQGNLYIVFSGDPSLVYNDLVELFFTLRLHQIQAIAGNVYIDNTAYDQRFYGPGWQWEDKKYYYAAPISASIINHNFLTFQMRPAPVAGRMAQVVTSPNYFYPTIKNSVITKASHTRACGLKVSNAGSDISIDGCMPAGRYRWGASAVVGNVSEYDRALFKNLLSRLSINVYGAVTFATAPQNLSLLGSHNSKQLRLLIKDMLKKSDNVIAGALFKKIGQLYTNRPGSWENGTLAVSQILSRKADVNITGLRILDGSGLSTANLTTPLQLMQVLDYAYRQPTSGDFISALPIAGIDGTLKYRMSHIARKVRAKTGTISGVVSLAGYVQTADKEPLAFVIMVNGSKGSMWRYRALEDKIATTLTNYRR